MANSDAQFNSLTVSRFYLRLTLIPIALFTALLLIIHAQPYDDHELRELLFPEGCPAPCFMGIRPGVTTMEEARTRLEASGWTRDFHFASGINLTGTDTFVSLTWQWNDNRSPLLDATSPAFIVGFEQSADALVDEIYVATTVPVGMIPILLQAPQRYRFGTLFPPASVTARILARLSTLYDKVEASVNLVCPLKFGGIWNLKSNLYFYSQSPINSDIHAWDSRAVIRTLKSACNG